MTRKRKTEPELPRHYFRYHPVDDLELMQAIDAIARRSEVKSWVVIVSILRKALRKEIEALRRIPWRSLEDVVENVEEQKPPRSRS